MKHREPYAYRLNRRRMLQLLATLPWWPGTLQACDRQQEPIVWEALLAEMEQLADHAAELATGHQSVARQGIQLLRRFDPAGAGFERAVNASYESGNQYWFWQRLVKRQRINGGVLHIESSRPVQLHDHPGATGMLRILDGEAEVWQFDEVSSRTLPDGSSVSRLARVSHRLMRPGDVAALTPAAGNIHALRAVSRQCRMLDFFIPSYVRSQRSWNEPVSRDWMEKETISCRRIAQHEYDQA